MKKIIITTLVLTGLTFFSQYAFALSYTQSTDNAHVQFFGNSTAAEFIPTDLVSFPTSGLLDTMTLTMKQAITTDSGANCTAVYDMTAVAHDGAGNHNSPTHITLTNTYGAYTFHFTGLAVDLSTMDYIDFHWNYLSGSAVENCLAFGKTNHRGSYTHSGISSDGADFFVFALTYSNANTSLSWGQTLTDNTTTVDFGQWSFCYTVDPTLFPGARPMHVSVNVDAGTQTDTLATFTSDFLTGTNIACARFPKNISLSTASHFIFASLIDENTATDIADTPVINLTIIAGTVTTGTPIPLITPGATADQCDAGNIFADAVCATAYQLFIPSGGYDAYFTGKVETLKDNVFTKAPFAYFSTIYGYANQTGLSESSPATTLALATPLAGGTTFNLTAMDTTSGGLLDTLHGTSIRTWISTFLWISFATYLMFRGYELFRPV